MWGRGQGATHLVRQLKVCGINETEMNIRVGTVLEAARHRRRLDNENTSAAGVLFRFFVKRVACFSVRRVCGSVV